MAIGDSYFRGANMSEEDGGLSDRDDLDDLSIREVYAIATPYEKVEMTVVIVAVVSMIVVATVVPDEAHDELEDAARGLKNTYDDMVETVDWELSKVRATIGVIRGDE